MEEPQESIGNGTDLDLEPLGEKPDPSTGPKMLVPLFVVPLLIVAVIVGLFLGFGAIVGGQESLEDLIHRVESGGTNDRWQAAAALTDRVRRDESLREDAELKARVRAAFESAPADRVQEREYLARLCGMLQDREAVPLLADAVRKGLAALEQFSEGSRPLELDRATLTFVQALGQLGDPAAADVVLELLTHSDSAYRMAAAACLGELYFDAVEAGGTVPEPVLQALIGLHEGDDAWGRMNAALALARLGSSAGLPTLELMLDTESYRRFGLEDPGDAVRFQTFALVMIEHLAERHPELAAGTEGEVLRAAVERVVGEETDSERRKLAQRVLGALGG